MGGEKPAHTIRAGSLGPVVGFGHSLRVGEGQVVRGGGKCPKSAGMEALDSGTTTFLLVNSSLPENVDVSLNSAILATHGRPQKFFFSGGAKQDLVTKK